VQRIKRFLAVGIIQKALEVEEDDMTHFNTLSMQQIQRKRKIQHFCAQIIRCSQHLKKMKISCHDIFDKNIFPAVAYARPGAKTLIEAAKVWDLNKAKQLLSENKFLLYDFDFINQTALHWAAKRDHTEMIELLIKYGCFIDAKDSSSRTALYLASKAGHVKSVKILLANEANPRIKTFMNLSWMDVAKTPQILSYLKKAYLWLIAKKFITKEQRYNVWNRESLKYFLLEEDSGVASLM